MLSVNKISFDDFNDYLLHEYGFALNTVNSYVSDLKAFVAWYFKRFSKKNLSEINKKIIYDYLITRLDSGINANSIKRFLSALKLFNRYLILQKIIQQDFSSSIEVPKASKKLPQIISESEMEKFFYTIPDKSIYDIRDKCIYRGLYKKIFPFRSQKL